MDSLILHWLLYLMALCAMCSQFIKYGIRSFVRPSYFFTFLLFIFYLSPMVLFRDLLFKNSQYAGSVIVFSSVFILLSMAIIHITNKSHYFRFDQNISKKCLEFPIIVLFFFVLTAIVVLYFGNVDIRNTGIYALLCNPSNYTVLRERSLKLLRSKWLVYVYSIGYTFVAPFLFSVSLDSLLFSARKKVKLSKILLFPLISFIIIFYLMITGARVGFIYLAFASSLIFFMRMKFLRFVASSSVLLIFAIVLTTYVSKLTTLDEPLLPLQGGFISCNNLSDFFRPLFSDQGSGDLLAELDELEKDSRRDDFKDSNISMGEAYHGILHRAFLLLPSITSFYFEEKILNSSKIAPFYSRKNNISNFVYRKYSKRIYGRSFIPTRTGTMPVAFPFLNFTYFGWYALLISLLGVFLLDALPLLFRLLNLNIPIFVLSTCSFYSLIFIQAAFFTTCLTHGYAIFVICSVMYLGYSKIKAFSQPHK